MSCSSDDDNIIATPSMAPELISPEDGTAIVLDPLYNTNPAVTLVWNHAGYNVPTEVTYNVEVAMAGTDFADVTLAGAPTSNKVLTLNVQELNTAAIAAGLVPFEAGELDMRVVATLGNNAEMRMESNVITITVTPYLTYPYTDLYLIGNATATGWDNSATVNMYPMFRDGENENIYHYTGYFAAGDFKAVEVKGQWAPQYGTDGTNIVPRPTESDPDPSPFSIATAGYYQVTLNLSDNSYSIVPFDVSSAPTYTTIGIIGTATPGGWDADTDMTVSDFDEHIWFIDNVTLTAGGEMKFRANDAWDVNWGGPTSYSGTGTPGGPNIPIGITFSGTYDVWFNDLTGRYIYIPQS